MDNRGLSRLIRDQGIDILVDLNGYSVRVRFPLFLGTRLAGDARLVQSLRDIRLPTFFFHYLVGDNQVVFSGEDRFYTEEVLRLPLSYLTFQVGYATPPVVAPPCRKNGYLTFGSLVAQYKITPPVLDCWCDSHSSAGFAFDPG